MEPGPSVADPRVLGRLLAASSALAAFSDRDRMADWVPVALAGVPGLAGCSACVRGASRPRPGAAAGCGDCVTPGGVAPAGGDPECALAARPGVRVFPLELPNGHHGFLVCEVADADRFAPYEPFVRNLAGSLALFVDRCEHREHLEATNAELAALRDRLRDLVAQRTAELETALARVRHLNAVLRGVRDVNQAIAREREPSRLAQAACDALVASRGHHCAWLAVADASGALGVAGMAGISGSCAESASPAVVVDDLPCVRAAMDGAPAPATAPCESCDVCPFPRRTDAGRALAVRVAHQGRQYGVLAVSAEPAWADDEEERGLLSALAADLGLGLDGLAQEEKRRRAETALAEERERLAVTLRSIGDGVITADTEGRIVLVNRVAEELTGWRQDEAVGRPLAEVFRIVHQTTRRPCEDPVSKVLASGMVVGLANHTVLLARDGRERVLADSGAPIRDAHSRIVGVVLVFRDVTVEHQMEAELRKAQKLESVGLLAGGIAHDFNNLLTAILGNVSLAGLEVPPGGKPATWLGEAEKAIVRARELTQQLLTFSKGGAPIRKAARIGETILDSTGFSLRGSNVRCEFSITDDLWAVEADLGQLSQVIGNLVINADEAMPDGGVIRVRARNLAPGDPRPPPLPDGRMVEVSVEDNGVGIAPEHLQRVFDPYFTTKKKGSGLGLATCYSIVRNHQGLITVESRQGRGTTFRVYLPATAAVPRARPPGEAVVQGRGRVLVMDDEEMVRSVCSQMLAWLGFEAATTADGAAAVEAYAAARADGRPFDAVILDVTVPGGMGGVEAVRHLLDIDSEARVIVSSGYSADPVMSEFRAHGFRGVAIKPYDLKGLSHALRDVLAASPG
ncbi:MAG: PAS domain S-box protein [Deltaproteobacteria bacterium]|nr:PAS domain S-box protein [Deltaproteobacteria bacterium]